MKAFEEETEVKTEEEKEEEEKKEEGKKAEAEVEEAVTEDTGEEPAHETAAEQTENLVNTTNLETGSQSEEEHGAEERPTKFFGYFSAILTDQTGSNIEDVFVSTSRQDFDSGTQKAYGIVNSSDYLEGEGRFDETPYLTRAEISEVNSGDLDTSRPISHTELRYNSYQEWGYWTMTTAITVGGDNYAIDNKGYYILGYYTPDAAMSRFSGTANYSGDAWGTYWSSAGGTDMTGTFNCAVNFGTASITDFDMSVNGGGKSATIEDASGSFASSHFSINKDTGTWSLTPGEPSYRRAVGSLYGPNGEYMGGAGGMKYSDTEGAAGIFQGKK